MGRSPCCDKVGLKKGTWTSEEDRKLFAYILQNGHGSWRSLPAKAGLQRCGKSCRLRWTNYLRPDIKRGQFSSEEEKSVIQLHALLGNRWSSIAAHLPKRTDNEIKNYWNTHLKKRLIKMGIDPATHKPTNSSTLSSTQQKRTANLSHIAQWETARLEAEARLRRANSKLTPPQNKPNIFPPLDIPKIWQGKWTENTSLNLSPTLNFFDNILTVQQPNSQRFPVMPYYEKSKSSLDMQVAEEKCPMIKLNDEHFDECPDFMDHGNEEDTKYWETILDDSISSSDFAYGSTTF